MKNKVIVFLLLISTAIVFTACTTKSAAVPASANAAGGGEAAGAAEMQSAELYPAYIIEGSEKKWGYINEKGSFAIEPKYDSADAFLSNGMALVSENGGYGLIDKSGKKVTESQYLSVDDFKEKTIIVTDYNGKSWLLDDKGNKLFETEGAIYKLSGGMAAFSKSVDKYSSLWGYIDDEGKVVVEPKYKWAQAFSGDKAIVESSEGHFGIIDKEGKLLKEIDNLRLTGLSKDVFVFIKNDGNGSQRYGYMNVDGTVMLDAVYSAAEEFVDGVAVVNAAKDYGNEFGLINKSGEYVIPAKYGQIEALGNGIYAVPVGGDSYFSSTFMKKALFDKTGKQLTEFIYYDLERLKNGLISATDENNTYLLDEKGMQVSSLPKVEGIGSIKSYGKLYRVEADNNLQYFTQDGKTVWTADNTTHLEGGLEVKVKTFRPDRCMLIQYPELSRLADPEVQDNINATLKELFVGSNKASNKEGDMYTETLDFNFTAYRSKDLLIISKSGYFYPIGAAHGQPIREDYHIDLKTGKLYALEDLFKKHSNYVEKLTQIINDMIDRTDKEYGEQMYLGKVENLEENSGFEIKKDYLRIYFHPYAIAAYAAGFPEFDIGYAELRDLINIEGELWRSLGGNLSGIADIQSNEVYPVDKAQIEEAIKNYESTMIEAINNNDFKLAEPWLYPESSLYNSQKKLVADLSRKQIKEKLEGYSIEAMKLDCFGMLCRVYVIENIGIQYPGKAYETKEFNWVYSLRYSYENRKYQLTYIDKWEKQQ